MKSKYDHLRAKKPTFTPVITGKKGPEKVPPEPCSKKKLSRFSLHDLSAVVAHLEAHCQTESVRYKQVIESIRSKRPTWKNENSVS